MSTSKVRPLRNFPHGTGDLVRRKWKCYNNSQPSIHVTLIHAILFQSQTISHTRHQGMLARNHDKRRRFNDKSASIIVVVALFGRSQLRRGQQHAETQSAEPASNCRTARDSRTSSPDLDSELDRDERSFQFACQLCEQRAMMQRHLRFGQCHIVLIITSDTKLLE